MAAYIAAGWPVYFFCLACVILLVGFLYCCLAVFIVVSWSCAQMLVGLCMVLGWPGVFLLFCRVYCCWLVK